MPKAVNTPYLVPFDRSFILSDAPTAPKVQPTKKEYKAQLKVAKKDMTEMQSMLYAHDYHSVLLVFQAMDAAGKDSTIRTVLSGLNPTGCQVSSFKQPSAEELDHDFLWRTTRRLPQRGRIGVFNRSYYEDVLVVRVHPEYLTQGARKSQPNLDELWRERYESIADQEKHLARNGTLILKFWLNVSQEEQHRRFLARLNNPEKNWKFSEGDIHESKRWDDYMEAYQDALNATSKPWAPWYAIPADNKHYMRLQVAQIIVESLKTLNVHYPTVSGKDKEQFEKLRNQLET